jgi:hypothetical protein
MATVVRAWRVDSDKLVEVPELRPSELGLVEGKLEDWLVSQPDAMQDNLLIIGRQVSTTSGALDLLGLTAEGKLVVVELKRDRAPRETVAQAIDYASWVATQTPDDIRSIAVGYLKQPLESAFQERFGQQLPNLQLNAPGILVVASRLDASTERMIEYLSEQHGMDIDGLVFRYIRLPSDEQILVRASVVSEERRIVAGESYSVSPEVLMSQARDRKIVPHVNVLRTLAGFLSEDPVRTYGGSFRYWGGQGRLLCGVNVVANWGAPDGSVDVWISHGNLAQASGVPEESLTEKLRSEFEFVRQYEGAHQMILRIKSEEEAAKMVDLLRAWLEGPQETPGGDVEGVGSSAAGDDGRST